MAQLGLTRPVHLSLEAMSVLLEIQESRTRQILVSLDPEDEVQISTWPPGMGLSSKPSYTNVDRSSTLLQKQGSWRSESEPEEPTGMPVVPQAAPSAELAALRSAFVAAYAAPSPQAYSWQQVRKAGRDPPDLETDPLGRHSRRVGSPAPREGTELTSAMIRANAGHESLDRLVELNLSLEQLGRLGSCLAICSSLQSLTLSNNSLSALQGAP